MTGAELKDNKFKFEVKENGVKVVEGISNEKGIINFGLINYEHKDIGTHVYTITEVNEHKTGITYDSTSYQVTVDVDDNHDGTMKITPHYPNGGVVFKNTYTSPSVDSAFIKLEGTKQLLGENLSGYKFKFQVKEDNKVICTGESDASGHIEFPYIFYYFTGTHNYEISEINDGQQWIGYDKKIYPVTVTVKYGKYGFLTAEVKYQGTDKAATFVNGYNGPKAEVSIAGTKKLIGANLKSEQFEFILSSEGKVIDTTTNKKDGTFAFDTIVYEEPGIHLYTVAEKNGKLNGIVYDRNKFDIKVTVTEAKNGELTATKEYQNGDVVFRNVKINSENWNQDNSNDPQTGDNQPIGLWLAFGGDALALLIFVLIRRRMKEDGEK